MSFLMATLRWFFSDGFLKVIMFFFTDGCLMCLLVIFSVLLRLSGVVDGYVFLEEEMGGQKGTI